MITDWVILVIGGLGLGLGGFFVARNPKFWVDLVKQVFSELLPAILKLFENRPKTAEEWAEWRELSSKPFGSLSPKEKERFKELKRLNREFKGK